MREKKFKPQFLFKNEVEIKRAKSNITHGVKNLNEFINKVETTLNIKLSDVEKVKIQETGLNIIYEILKAKFPFPNATHDFNLQALGIDLKPLERDFNKLSHTWNDYGYKLNKEGIFESDKSTIKNAIDRHTHYTTNERQNIALKMAKELELIFSNVNFFGHLKQYNCKDIENVTGLLEYSFNDKKELRIQPDYYYIKQIV